MAILRNYKSIGLIIIFILIDILITTFPSDVYCDNWVYLGKSDDYKLYYNNSKIRIDHKNKQIKVWIKIYREFKIKIDNKNIFNKKLELITFDYGDWKYCIMSEVVHPSIEEIWGTGSSEQVEKSEIEWHNIIPESINDIILNKIIKDYKINR